MNAPLILVLMALSIGECVEFRELTTNITAHGADPLDPTDKKVITTSFYNDNSRYVTGGVDYKVRIWDTDDQSLITTLTYLDQITNVGLHP